MMRWLGRLMWRLFWIGLLGGAGYLAYKALNRRQPEPATSPQWSPLPTAHEPASTPAPAPRWVEPTNGGCPAGFPVKVNTNSGIFHVPGGRSYVRTGADRCYASADDAIADGFRPAKA